MDVARDRGGKIINEESGSTRNEFTPHHDRCRLSVVIHEPWISRSFFIVVSEIAESHKLEEVSIYTSSYNALRLA